jgi:hypothetical protein
MEWHELGSFPGKTHPQPSSSKTTMLTPSGVSIIDRSFGLF